jgi:hypothetical protein
MKVKTTEPANNSVPAKAPLQRGRAAVWQARLVLLVMINLAQLWILSAAVDAALGHEFRHLLPLVVASGLCWLISLSILIWWKPAGRRQSGSA